MAQSKHEIQALLGQAGAAPRHRFGQNFMIDQNLVRLVAEAGQLAPGEHVIEIGPGTGTLTDELLSRGAHVLAVEIDRDLAPLLRERFSGREQFHLIQGDALAGKHGLNPELLQAIRAARNAAQTVKLVANLPYNIASPLIIELLAEGVELLAFTVQKEVADRLRAAANDEAYGGLTVMAQLLAEVEILRTLPPQAFWPPPKIDSALVRLRRRDRIGPERPAFGLFIQQMFSARRKTLRKGLAQIGVDAEPVLQKVGLDRMLRPEAVSPDDFFRLYRAIGGLGRS